MSLALKKSKHQMLLAISSLIFAFALFSPFMAGATSEREDPYSQPGLFGGKKSIISESISDPTMASNLAPFSDGLPEIPGVPWFNESRIKDVSKLEHRTSRSNGMINEITQIQGKLEIEREEAFKKSGNFIRAGASRVINYFDESDTESVFYNEKRLNIIDAMLTNATVKLNFLLNDIAINNEKISNIRLKEARNTGDITAINAAVAENEQKKKETIETRKNIQRTLAELKANHDASTCWSFTGGINLGVCVMQVTGWIANIIVRVFSLLLWIASKIFDASVSISILNIDNLFKSSSAVALSWTTLRDLANLGFVFVLLYIAIGTVFELSGMGEPRRLIVNVIIIALLVNFSGFFTRVVIDASNIIAYEFYDQMKGEDNSLSTNLVKKMNLSAYFIETSSTQTEAFATAGEGITPPMVVRLSFPGIIGQTFGNIIIILVTSFVLLTAAILFIIRTIYLLFLYIFSPLAFISYIIPGKEKYFHDWLSKLISQAFFAPAFLIPLYIVFKLLGENGIVGIVKGGGIDQVMANVLIIGLLFGCIFIANKFGAAGAKLATGVAGGATLLGAKGITQGSKYLGGKAGRGMSQWAKKVGDKEIAEGKTWARRSIGAATIRGVQAIAKTPGKTGERMSNWAKDIATKTASAKETGERGPNIFSRIGASAVSSAPKIKKDLGQSEAGKKITSFVKNPLLGTSEAIVNIEAAMRSGGGGSYSFLGKTSKERKDAEEETKKEKERDKKKELKDKSDQLNAATKTGDNDKIDKILGDISTKDIDKIEKKVLLDVAKRLSYVHLVALQNKIKDLDFTPVELDKMKTVIVNDNTSPGYTFMVTGPGREKWGTPTTTPIPTPATPPLSLEAQRREEETKIARDKFNNI